MKKIKFIAPVLATVTGLAAGAAAFGCSCNPGSKEVKVTGMEISQSSLTMKVNDEQTIFATITPENATNKKVKWEITSGSEFISIDKTETTSKETITVKALGLGDATIKATSDGDSSFTKTCTISVKEEIIGASIKKVHEVKPEESIEAEVTIDPTSVEIKSIEWTAEDPSVIELTPNGKNCSIKGLVNGKSKLTIAITDPFGVKTVSTTVYVQQTSINEQLTFESVGENKVSVTAKGTLPANLFIPECDPENPENIVTEIKADAFKSKTSIKTVSLPDTIEKIGNSAFSGCNQLKSAHLPDKVKELPYRCFYMCTSLEKCNLPANLEKIGHAAFQQSKISNSNFPSQFPSTLVSIDSWAFGDCWYLTNVVIPKSVVSLGEFCFYRCGKNDSANNFEIKFEDVSEGEDVTMNIGSSILNGATTLKSVTFPTNKKVELMSGATCILGNCNVLEKITLSKNSFVNTYLTGYEFKNCPKLTTLEIPSDHPVYSLVSYDETDGKALVARKTTTNEQHAILLGMINPTGEIDLTKLGTLTDYPITEISKSAFRGSSITSVNIPSTFTSIGSYAFADCTSLSSINIPSTITSIESYTFNKCTSLASIELPSALASIGSNAFEGCSALASIVIPSSVNSIGGSAFTSCNALKDITVDSTTIAKISNPGNLFSKIAGRVVKVPEGTTVGSTLANTSNYTKSGPEGGYDIYTATA